MAGHRPFQSCGRGVTRPQLAHAALGSSCVQVRRKVGGEQDRRLVVHDALGMQHAAAPCSGRSARRHQSGFLLERT